MVYNENLPAENWEDKYNMVLLFRLTSEEFHATGMTKEVSHVEVE